MEMALIYIINKKQKGVRPPEGFSPFPFPLIILYQYNPVSHIYIRGFLVSVHGVISIYLLLVGRLDDLRTQQLQCGFRPVPLPSIDRAWPHLS